MFDFNKTVIVKNKKYKQMTVKNPILIAGLPGLGNVGVIIADLLIHQFKGIKIASVYSNHFPHQVIMLKNGTIRLLNNRFYLIKSFNKSQDLIVLTGDTQAITPEGQYEVNSKILDYFKNKLKGRFIFTIGGYINTQENIINPRVFGNVTNKKLIDKFKKYNIIFKESQGTIFGSLGLLTAFAKMQNIDGLCLMGETQNPEFDPASVKAIASVLNKIFNININTKELDKMIKLTNPQINELPMPQFSDTSDSTLTPSYIR